MFTIIYETQPPNCGFHHEMLYLAVLTIVAFATWAGVRLLATTKALTHLCTYMKHLLAKLERQPFRFLDLPPELRNLVYDHHFALYRTPWYHQKAREGAMLPDAILNVNRQVYEEASHALYSRLIFVVKTSGRTNVQGHQRSFARVVRKMPNFLRHLTIIRLEIHWPRSGWVDLSGKGERHGRPVTELKKNITTVCTSLTKLPDLRMIKIFFLVEESLRPSWPLIPARHRIPGLLRPLKLVRRVNPEIVVELPECCPISTAELVEQQRDWACGTDRLEELDEDLEEDLGNEMMLDEEFRRLDEQSGW
ncbi:MAG: hypothetical protein ALECFALPRED_008555 [Alectoria fallacina]|uniref:Uncharacterized protein n=1 Tax=Alectoria fallacina TaxID=1903189 RepID=A0A8H3ECR7_9LECA|nr:MAG: hypothetical protein ALECFALPRED_008555 [Alectoria fallacina]